MLTFLNREGQRVPFNIEKIYNAIYYAINDTGVLPSIDHDAVINYVESRIKEYTESTKSSVIPTAVADSIAFNYLTTTNKSAAQKYIECSEKKKRNYELVKENEEFLRRYTNSDNNANATVDDNSNVNTKTVANLNSEIYKESNIIKNRGMIINKLKELNKRNDASWSPIDPKQYKRDLESHIIYKNDESSSNSGATMPYCVSISMYPFVLNGLKDLGYGNSNGSPKHLLSYCSMFNNLIFNISSQFAGAVAASEFLIFFDYYARKDFGDKWYNSRTNLDFVEQMFQMVVHTINQPAGGRGNQAVFFNLSIFDKYYFDAMFSEMIYPDFETKPCWESISRLQKFFLMWFLEERKKTPLAFPVISYSMLTEDGKYKDEETFDFLCDQLSKGDDSFIYNSNSADSLASCCFSKNTKVLWKSSTLGVNITTLEELHNTKWEPSKRNLRIFHNGSWVSGKSIKLPNRKMYKVVTSNHKEYYMTDNHINVTYDGEKTTDKLTTNDYLMFNTTPLYAISENNEHLTYEMGFAVGAFLGDGSFGTRLEDGSIYEINYSQNIDKYQKCIKNITIANHQLCDKNDCRLNSVYNNVYSCRISSKILVSLIQKWTNWKEGTYSYNKTLNMNCLLQSLEFRKGILDGWYNTDGGNSNRCYTSSESLKDCMEVLITSLGMNTIIDVSDRTDEKVIIRDEEYNKNYPLWCVRWYEPCNKRDDLSYKWKNNNQYFKIDSIQEVEYTDDVYCIERKDQDKPYFTLPSGLITHNCRLRNEVDTKEFNFTNGNIGIMTGSKSVITINLNRLAQLSNGIRDFFSNLSTLCDRIAHYHVAYNELIWDSINNGLLPVYTAGFIDADKQFLTIGLNGLNEAAEWFNYDISNNAEYLAFVNEIGETIDGCNKRNSGVYFGHKIKLNCEFVPAESLGVKNCNWDKADGFEVPYDRILYSSYVFQPFKPNTVLDRIAMHGSKSLGTMGGGSACHINITKPFTKDQYKGFLEYAAKVGCSYLTFNLINTIFECGHTSFTDENTCPICSAKAKDKSMPIIGYRTAISQWSSARQQFFKSWILATE